MLNEDAEEPYCAKYVASNVTHDVAEATCKDEEGATLPAIHSEVDNAFFQGTLHLTTKMVAFTATQCCKALSRYGFSRESAKSDTRTAPFPLYTQVRAMSSLLPSTWPWQVFI